MPSEATTLQSICSAFTGISWISFGSFSSRSSIWSTATHESARFHRPYLYFQWRGATGLPRANDLLGLPESRTVQHHRGNGDFRDERRTHPFVFHAHALRQTGAVHFCRRGFFLAGHHAHSRAERLSDAWLALKAERGSRPRGGSAHP